MKTAVKLLEEKLKTIIPVNLMNDILIKNAIIEANGMEKQQIIDANIAGMEFIAIDPCRYKEDANNYYYETFKN